MKPGLVNSASSRCHSPSHCMASCGEDAWACSHISGSFGIAYQNPAAPAVCHQRSLDRAQTSGVTTPIVPENSRNDEETPLATPPDARSAARLQIKTAAFEALCNLRRAMWPRRQTEAEEATLWVSSAPMFVAKQTSPHSTKGTRQRETAKCAAPLRTAPIVCDERLTRRDHLYHRLEAHWCYQLHAAVLQMSHTNRRPCD